MRDKKVRPLYLFFFLATSFFASFLFAHYLALPPYIGNLFFFFMHEQSRDSDIKSAKLKFKKNPCKTEMFQLPENSIINQVTSTHVILKTKNLFI